MSHTRRRIFKFNTSTFSTQCLLVSLLLSHSVVCIRYALLLLVHCVTCEARYSVFIINSSLSERCYMYGPTAVTQQNFFTSVTFLHSFQENVISNKSVVTTVSSIFINYSQSCFWFKKMCWNPLLDRQKLPVISRQWVKLKMPLLFILKLIKKIDDIVIILLE